jgi:hypothetical protein
MLRGPNKRQICTAHVPVLAPGLPCFPYDPLCNTFSIPNFLQCYAFCILNFLQCYAYLTAPNNLKLCENVPNPPGSGAAPSELKSVEILTDYGRGARTPNTCSPQTFDFIIHHTYKTCMHSSAQPISNKCKCTQGSAMLHQLSPGRSA